MIETVKASSYADFIALVPQMLGFQPAESVVLVPFHGPRSLGAMRFDFHADQSPVVWASSAVGMALRVPTIDGMVAVVYSTTAAESQIEDALLAIDEQLQWAGVSIVDLLYVTGEVAGTFKGSQELPLSELPQLGVPVTATNNIPPLPEPMEKIEPIDAADALLCLLPIGLFKSGPTASMVGMLHAVLNLPAARDVLLIEWALGRGDEALEAQMAWEEGAEYPQELAGVMMGEGARPDPKKLELALEFTRLSIATHGASGGGYAMAAWLSWALGRSTHALQYAVLADSAEPGHGLAQIVRAFVDAGHLPAWAFQS
jgi:hypothetical protein